MDEDQYFVVRNTEDGVNVTGPSTKQQLEADLNRGEYGDKVEFLTRMPVCYDGQLQCGDRQIVIIKGTLVVATKIQWKLP